MYPKNAASPQRIAIGPVVLIADGTVQTATVSVKVLPQGGTASAGGGTIAYEEGIVHYLPTQAETNYASFMLIAYKASCIPASVTVVTSASAVAGHAGLDWATINAPTTTQALSGTTVGVATNLTNLPAITANWLTAAGIAADAITDAKVASDVTIASVTGAVGSVTGAVGSVTGAVGSVTGAVGSVTGNVGGNVTGSVGSVTGAVGSVTGAVGSVTGLTASDVGAIKTKTDYLPSATAGAAGGLFIAGANAATSITTALTANITGNVSGSVGSLTGHTAQTGDCFPFANRTVVRGTVAASPAPSTTGFTASALSPAGVAADQFKGRVIIFDNATTTTSLRGQATTISASSAAALPAFTYTALTTAPASGDAFSIV